MTPLTPQPLNIQTIETSRLFLNIELALGVASHSVSPDHYLGMAEVSPADHFRVVRLVLRHLLREDISYQDLFPETSEDTQARKLYRIYQSEKAWKLYADVMGIPVSDVTPGLVHRFFSRIAWLDESVVTSERARNQLDEYLHGVPPLRRDKRLPLSAYSYLKELLTPVPEDLRSWMVQFKRGGRLMPIPEWITRSAGRSLYDGVSLAESGEGRPLLSVWADATAALLPPGEYRDSALRVAFDGQLGSRDTWKKLELYLALSESIPPCDGLQIDFKTHLPASSRAAFYRKVTTYVVNPEGEGWLAEAISNALNAPGMCFISLAIELRFKHPDLTFQAAMTLSVMLLRAEMESFVEISDPLPPSRIFNVDIPPLQTWSEVRNANELFQKLGIELLCRPEQDNRGLKWGPSQTWNVLMQTAQFKTLFAPLLASLNWYGAQSGEKASPLVTQALAGRAIVDYFLGASSTFAEPLAKTFQGVWLGRYSHVELCERVKADIRLRQPDASSSTLEMLYYLLVREEMPELLVIDVPDHLQYGRSLQSVALIHGMALLENMRPGSFVAPRYDDVIRISADLAQSSDADIHALWARTLITPALRYAIAHGAIEWSGTDAIDQATPVQISLAMNYLKTRQEQHASDLNDLLSIKPPDRKHLAQDMLTQAGVDQSLWEQRINIHRSPILQQHGFTIAFTYKWDRMWGGGPLEPTVQELVMMGEAYIRGIPTIPEAYDSAFASFRESFISAQSRIMASLLFEMSEVDRSVLLDSTCEVSRVAFGEEEGMHGLFVRCQPGDHRASFHDHRVAGDEVFYELIPAAGVVRKIAQRFNYNPEPLQIDSTDIRRLFEVKHIREEQLDNARITPLLPFDSDAYLLGAASRSVGVFEHPREGKLIPGNKLIYLPDANNQSRIDVFARTATDHLFVCFLEKDRVEHRHDTDWETAWAREREYADMVARMIIPFYGCIRDLAQDDHSSGVIVECVMDLAAALIPVGLFVGSTARIVLRAGAMSVESVLQKTGQAVGRLIVEMARQSTLFAVRDIGKFTFKIGRVMWADMQLIRNAKGGFSFQKAVFQIIDDTEHAGQLRSTLDRQAVLDGRREVSVRNVGTLEKPDFRQLYPESDGVFGRRLTVISQLEPMEFSGVSATSGIEPGRYPAVLPVTEGAEGGYEIRIAESCQVKALEREEGVFHVLVDDEVYHLDVNAPDAAMRRFAINKLSSPADWLEVENLCRARRDLSEVPCATGIKLVTSEAAPVAAGSISPKRTGKYPSQAMNAREFTLARLSANNSQDIDVFVHEGKFCKWAEPSPATSPSARRAKGKRIIPLDENELSRWLLHEPVYLDELDGFLGGDSLLGLPGNFDLEDARYIYEHAPAIELGPVSAQIQDSRALRGIRMSVAEEDCIVIEADTGTFYKARVVEGRRDLKFFRVNDSETINDYLRLSEQYRLARERSNIEQDRENIARLLYELMAEPDRAEWSVHLREQINSYDDYARWCAANNEPNDILRHAGNILAGESAQTRFVELARSSIPDFKKITLRTGPEKQHILETLNRLLPVQDSSAPWDVLSLESVIAPDAADMIIAQTKPANLSFAQVLTESGDRVVYYSLSGGKKAKNLKLKINTTEATEQVIDGIIYRDARARIGDREPDPRFTSLPVVRDGGNITVRGFRRELDAERLIATALSEDMANTRLTHIRFFTVLDTCRSCGGMVLPRLKLDFPDAEFSVTYLREYKRS